MNGRQLQILCGATCTGGWEKHSHDSCVIGVWWAFVASFVLSCRRCREKMGPLRCSYRDFLLKKLWGLWQWTDLLLDCPEKEEFAHAWGEWEYECVLGVMARQRGWLCRTCFTPHDARDMRHCFYITLCWDRTERSSQTWGICSQIHVLGCLVQNLAFSFTVNSRAAAHSLSLKDLQMVTSSCQLDIWIRGVPSSSVIPHPHLNMQEGSKKLHSSLVFS